MKNIVRLLSEILSTLSSVDKKLDKISNDLTFITDDIKRKELKINYEIRKQS